jgi:hypothetical protein
MVVKLPELHATTYCLMCVVLLIALPADCGSVWGQAATDLSPALIAKAKDFKDADTQYVKVLCDEDLKKQRSSAKDARDKSAAELDKAMSSAIDQAPEVQRALDVAVVAGDDASKAASDPNASAQDKAAASAKFQKAKDVLRDTVTHVKARMDDQILKQFGVLPSSNDSCPEQPKAASSHVREKAKVARERAADRPVPAARDYSAPAPAPILGGGGIGIGVGGIGITIGR